MILKSLDDLSLLASRRVCKSWNITASEISKKRPIWIRRKWDSKAFQQLNNCITRSENFPFCGLDLELSTNMSTAGSENALRLFARHRTIFTHLRASCLKKDHAEPLKSFLTFASSKLQYLEIGNLCSGFEITALSLPSLRTLRFRDLHDDYIDGRLLE